jgi:hypothetical protein
LCLNVSCRLDFKKWQARGDADNIKNKKKNRKKILDDFRQKLGLIVDQPKQGFGSTNDGYTARRFFEKSLISASLTGLDLAIWALLEDFMLLCKLYSYHADMI